MQMRRRPIRDGLDAVLGGVLTRFFWCLKCGSGLTVLNGNFHNEPIKPSEYCLGANKASAAT